MSSTPETIGLLTWDYAQPKGGMGRSLQHIVEVLRSVDSGAEPSGSSLPAGRQAQHHALCHPEPGRRMSWFERPHHDTPGGAPKRIINVFAPYGDKPLLSFTSRFGGQILFSLLLPFVLEQRLRVINKLLLPVGPGGVLLLRRPSVPATAIVYHSYAQQSALVPGQWWKQIFKPFERRTLRYCSSIICFCQDTKDALVRSYGIDPSRITVLSHAVSVSSQAIERDPLLCVCVARLEARKGVDVLVRAWPRILQSVPGARLVIVGDGAQRGKIDRMISKLTGVERRPSLPQKELDLLLAQASVACCPAYLEGFGLACAEAMAAGCCVIASDTDGLRSLVDMDSGMLVTPGDDRAFADAVIRALRNETLRTRLGKNAAARIKHLCDPASCDAALAAAV